MRNWRCWLGHRWMVTWRNQTTPLWASQMLLAVTAMQGVTIRCGRCGLVGVAPGETTGGAQ